MAKARAAYPQVEPGALGLANRGAVDCEASLSVRQALDWSERAGAQILVIRAGAPVRREDLVRAVAWGLGNRPIRDLAFGHATELPARASETRVRRALHAGSRLVILRDRGRLRGAVDAAGFEMARPAVGIAHRLEQAEDDRAEARLWLLRTAGKVGEALGLGVYAVGGLVRDALSGAVTLDVDLAVEGESATLARRLGEEVGGRVALHPTFGTASIHDGRTPDGLGLGRVDIASTRREQYDLPGALPRVSPAGIEDDLLRRDFSVNAMAVTLAPGAFGRLLDPCGGQRDIRAGRLRALHPLSFVEDPTRVFRAARYATRLGFVLDRGSRRALGLALQLAPYPALSGPRLFAEMERLTAESEGWKALSLLLRWKALALWDRGYRHEAGGSRRLRQARRLAAWAEARDVDVDRIDLALIALLMDQAAPTRRHCLGRLGVTGARLARLGTGLSDARALARRLALSPRGARSALASRLRPWPPAALAAAWLAGGRLSRRRVEWFLAEGRRTRPLLAGAGLLALGVARGPRVGHYLARLRDLRLDGRVRTAAEERSQVQRWLHDERGGAR